MQRSSDLPVYIHAFVCTAALAYLPLMKQMLAKKGIFISVYKAIEDEIFAISYILDAKGEKA